MDTIRLLARADDAGMNGTANRAIRSTVIQGIVRNVGLMAPAPKVQDHVLGGLDVDYGLHLTMTAEWANLRWGPVHAESAVFAREDGTLPYTTEELADSGVSAEAAVREAEAQLDRLTRLGFHITYLDEHMGVAGIGDLAAALSEFASKKGLVYHRDVVRDGRLGPLDGWNDPAEHPGTELADFLSSLSGGSYYLVGHPAFKSEEMMELHQPARSPGHEMTPRNRQRRMFADIEIVDYCENRGIELIRYRDL